MTEITILKSNNELWADSRDVAISLDVNHNSLQRLIKKYHVDFRSFGILGFEIEESTGPGQPVKYTLLNEDQCYFLLTLVRNSKRTVAAKKELVGAFSKARALLHDWQQSRLEGKVSRRVETDTIKEFVEYAESKGSKNAKFYYSLLTKGTYKALYILERGADVKDMRQRLGVLQLQQLAVAENLLQRKIRDLMDDDVPYKDIYKLALAELDRLVEVLGKQLPGEDQNIFKIK